MVSTFTAFIDANVFYGARLRSLVLFLAQTGLFRARWSAAVHHEWTRNLLAGRPDLRLALILQRDDGTCHQTSRSLRPKFELVRARTNC